MRTGKRRRILAFGMAMALLLTVATPPVTAFAGAEPEDDYVLAEGQPADDNPDYPLANNVVEFGDFETDSMVALTGDEDKNNSWHTEGGYKLGSEWQHYEGNGGYAAFNTDAAHVASGSQSLQVNYNGKDSWLNWRKAAEGGEWPGGGSYRVRFWYKSDIDISMIPRMDDASGSGVGYSYINLPANPEGGYYDAIHTLADQGTGKNQTLRIQFTTSRSNGTSGTYYLDDFHVIPRDYSVRELVVEKSELVLYAGDSLRLSAQVVPADAKNTLIDWKSEDVAIATVSDNGTVTGVAAGQTTLWAAARENPEIKQSVAVEVKASSGMVEELRIDQGNFTLREGDVRRLSYSALPASAANVDMPVKWLSSNVGVATITEVNGQIVLKATGEGTANITVKNEEFGLESAPLEIVVNGAADSFDAMRKKYADFLFMVDGDVNDAQYMALLDSFVEQAELYWNSMNRNASATSKLWTSASGYGKDNNDLHVFYRYLMYMAIAYTANGSPHQYDEALYLDILYGLEWLRDVYVNKTLYISNGWANEIGMPQLLGKVLTLLYNHLPSETLERYLDQIWTIGKVENPIPFVGTTSTGANRTDRCLTTILYGILARREESITRGVNAVFEASGKVVSFTSSGDGFYYDGSFIQHNNVPYNNSYGTVLLTGLAEISLIVEDESAYSFDENNLAQIYTYISEGFLPQMYKGVPFYSTRGRAISRQSDRYGNKNEAHVRSILILANAMPEVEAAYLRGVCKQYLQSNPMLLENCSTPLFAQLFYSVLQDGSIQPVAEPTGAYTFNRMARSTQRQADWVYDIAMHNYRIMNYETGNDENYLSYHTADGMTYLYNADITQYGEDYWATVDYKRLAGTTVDTLEISALRSQNSAANANIRWAGGASLGDTLASGIALHKTANGMSLTANKSWFSFGNEVVALGSNISSGSSREIETTVDNRRLSAAGSEAFIVDGNAAVPGLGSSDSFANPQWAHLSGRVSGADIGYYFPGGIQLEVLRETRTGSWRNVSQNTSFLTDDSEVSENYLTMYVNHGAQPNSDTYQYVVLPGMSATQTAAYAQNPGVEILAVEPEYHAVRHPEHGIVAINNFGKGQVEAGGVKVDKEAAVIVEFGEDSVRVAVTQLTARSGADAIVRVELPDVEGLDVLHKESNVTVVSESPYIVLEVNTNIGAYMQNTWVTELSLKHDGSKSADNSFTALFQTDGQSLVVPHSAASRMSVAELLAGLEIHPLATAEVIDENGQAVTSGYVADNMRVRITAENGDENILGLVLRASSYSYVGDFVNQVQGPIWFAQIKQDGEYSNMTDYNATYYSWKGPRENSVAFVGLATRDGVARSSGAMCPDRTADEYYAMAFRAPKSGVVELSFDGSLEVRNSGTGKVTALVTLNGETLQTHTLASGTSVQPEPLEIPVAQGDYVRIETINANHTSPSFYCSPQITYVGEAAAEAPGAPRNLEVLDVTETSARVAWQAPADGEVTGYTVALSGGGKNFTETVNSTTFAYTFVGLSGGTEYSAKVVATNANGDGFPATTSFTTVDKSTLAYLLGCAESHLDELDGLIETARKKYLEIYGEAKSVYENDAAGQDTVDTAGKNLLLAAGLLSYLKGTREDIQALSDLVADAGNYAAADYEQDAAWTAFAQTLAAARAMLQNAGDTTRGEMQDMYKELLGAMGALNPKTPPANINKTELAKVVAWAEEIDLALYLTDELAFANLANALANAKDILGRDDVSREQVESARNALLDAIQALRLKVDRQLLEDMFGRLKKLDESLYTPQSFAILAAALREAEALLAAELEDNEENRQRINAATLALQAAENGLVLLDNNGKTEPGGGDGGDENTAAGGTGTAGAIAKTGDTGYGALIALALIAALGAGGCIALRLRRKTKRREG